MTDELALFDVTNPDRPALIYRKPYPRRKRCRDCHQYAQMVYGGGVSAADDDTGGDGYFYIICLDCARGRNGFRSSLCVDGLHGRTLQEATDG